MNQSYVVAVTVEHDVVVDDKTTAVFSTEVKVVLSGESALDAVYSALLLIGREYGDSGTVKFRSTKILACME